MPHAHTYPQWLCLGSKVAWWWRKAQMGPRLLCTPTNCSVNCTVEKKICMPFRTHRNSRRHMSHGWHMLSTHYIFICNSHLCCTPRRAIEPQRQSLLPCSHSQSPHRTVLSHSLHEPGLSRHNFLRCNVWLFLAFWPAGLLWVLGVEKIKQPLPGIQWKRISRQNA